MTDNEIIKAKSMLKKLEEAYEAYYDTSKGMPYDIDVTLRETAICLEKALNEINRQKAEIERLRKQLYNAEVCIDELEYAYEKVGHSNSRVDEALEKHNLVKEMVGDV
ncbi:MAG: hypothetical protein IKK11_00880 [Oscillospiraceae bacterium]|nr:hypothetical protein [Oscillospiraceae bacterium]